MPRGSYNARGFTLIEVLVALVIVAVSMTGAILVVTQRARDGTYLRDKTLAHWIAMNLLTERRLQTAAPRLGKSSDGLEFGGRQWRWTIEVTETAVDSMRRLDVRVRPAEAPEESALATLSGFFGTAVGAATGAPTRWEGEPADTDGQGPGEDADNGTDETDDTDDTDDTSGDVEPDPTDGEPDVPLDDEPQEPTE
jgi:general secretion pathway protein I